MRAVCREAPICRHEAEQCTELREVISVFTMVPVACSAAEWERRLPEIRLPGPFALVVGLVAKRASMVAIDAHGAVTMIVVNRAAGRVDQDQMMIDAQTVALGITVGEQSPLQYLVRGKADAGHDAGEIERVIGHRRRVRLGHDLHLERSFGAWITLNGHDLDGET